MRFGTILFGFTVRVYGILLALVTSFSQVAHSSADVPEVIYPKILTGNNKADYIIIAPDIFIDTPSIREFAEWRSGYSGLDVAVVSISAIEGSFPGNLGSIENSIHSFLSHAYENWRAPHTKDGRVRYVLLVGDVEHIPTHISQSTIYADKVAGDNWYACVSGNYPIPDLLIGRIPAKETADLDVMLQKIIRYESDPLPGDWANRILMLEGTIGDFNDYIKSSIKEYFEPAGYEVKVLSALNGDKPLDVIEAINAGQHIVYYTGHGWLDSTEIFNVVDILGLTNYRELPVFFSISCDTGRFDDPDGDCLGESLLKSPNGAVAFFGASRIGSLGNIMMTQGFSEALTGDWENTLGEIIHRMKTDPLQDESNMELFNLLGDPALDIHAARRRSGEIDLVVPSLKISVSPDDPRPGDEVSLEVLVKNIGDSDAFDVTVEMMHSPYASFDPEGVDFTMTRLIPVVKASGEAKCRFGWIVPPSYCSHSFHLMARAGEGVDEHFLANNEADVTVTVSIDMDGWPIKTDEIRLSAMIAADIDGDGDMELLTQSGEISGSRKIYAWHHDGQTVEGWPKQVVTSIFQPGWWFRHWVPFSDFLLYQHSQYINPSAEPAPAVGDIDGDGKPEIVAALFSKNIWAWRSDGSVCTGWPVSASGYATSSPVIADLNSDGKLEVLFGTSDGKIHVVRGYDGSELSGWPRETLRQGHIFPLAADINGDGRAEIIAVQTPFSSGNIGVKSNFVHVWQLDGTPVSGWSVEVEGSSSILPASVGDLDGDGRPEIILPCADSVYVWDHTGSPKPGWPKQVDSEIESAVALGDLDEDGDIEIIASSKKDLVYAWHHDGRPVYGWPIRLDGNERNSSPIIADIDGDSRSEVIFTAYDSVYAYNTDGSPAEGFPVVVGFKSHRGIPPAVVDMDGDGTVEIAFASDSGEISVISTRGKSSLKNDWPMFLHDPLHTNSLNTDVILPQPPTELTAVDLPDDNGNNIQLSWRLSPDDGDISGYVVFRAEQPDGEYSVIGEVPSGTRTYVDSSSAPGKIYWYVVRAARGRYLSAQFDPVSVLAINDSAPARPEVTEVSPGESDGTLVVRWKPNGDPDIAGYRIYLGDESGKYGSPVDVGMRTSYMLTNLSNGVTYYVAITAYDTEGHESMPSDEHAAVPVDDDTDPPDFSGFLPREVAQGCPFRIKCRISDRSGIYDDPSDPYGQSVYLIWDDDGELARNHHAVPMSLSSDGFVVTDEELPPHLIGEKVIYQVSAFDNDFDDESRDDRTRGISKHQFVTFVDAPTVSRLRQNYPNPFNPDTWIPYELSEDSEVSIVIHDANGRLVKRIDLGFVWRGRYIEEGEAAYWDGRNEIGEPVSSGVYFYTIRTGNLSSTRRMLLLK